MHSNSKFQEAVKHVEAAYIIRHKTTVVMGAAMSLSEPANAVLSSISTDEATQMLKERYAVFDATLFDATSATPFKLKTAEKAALDGIGIGARIRFERVFREIAVLGAEMKRSGTETVTAITIGDRGSAATGVERSNVAFVAILEKLRASSAYLDEVGEKVIAKSVTEIGYGTKLQYLIAMMIAAMVAAVVTYAHFVGRILARKFKELEKAHEDSEKFSAQMQVINDEVTSLNRDLADKMKDLTDAQDELVKKGRLEQLGQLTATVAHELRNPLGAVRTSAFLVARKTKDKNLGIEPQLERINNGIVRCDNIITQLLDFSRTQLLATQPADLDSWLAKVVEEEAGKLSPSIGIEVILGLDEIPVPFDPSRLQRAVVNLLNNSSEAMVGQAKEAPAFVCPNPTIKISTCVVGDHVVIEVQDNGPGMTDEVLRRIREPLFTTKSFGTGLGVPAIEQIANQHGGTLSIASSPGNGATFKIQLPLKGVKRPQAEAA